MNCKKFSVQAMKSKAEIKVKFGENNGRF